MYRIGLLVPSSNTIMEPDFYKMAPKGVTIHSARMKLLDFNEKALINIVDDVEREVELLASANVEVIIYGCSTCSLIGGVDWEKILVNQLIFETNIKVFTVNQAVVEAIRKFNGRKIGIVTPYGERLSRLEQDYLIANGLKVSACSGLGLHNPHDIAKVEKEKIMKQIEKAANSNCDVIYVGCTNLPVVELIEEIETKWGMPVVTSNQAAIWFALKGYNIVGFGKLFSA